MTGELDRIFRTLLSDVYREVMKPRGFNRAGMNFRKIETQGLVTTGMIVNFQKSQWNTAEELRFTVNTARKMVVGGEIDPKFKEYECHFSDRKRPQGVSPKYDRDQWWSITVTTDYAALKTEIEDFLTGYSLTWLEGKR